MMSKAKPGDPGDFEVPPVPCEFKRVSLARDTGDGLGVVVEMSVATQADAKPLTRLGETAGRFAVRLGHEDLQAVIVSSLAILARDGDQLSRTLLAVIEANGPCNCENCLRERAGGLDDDMDDEEDADCDCEDDEDCDSENCPFDFTPFPPELQLPPPVPQPPQPAPPVPPFVRRPDGRPPRRRRG